MLSIGGKRAPPYGDDKRPAGYKPPPCKGNDQRPGGHVGPPLQNDNDERPGGVRLRSSLTPPLLTATTRGASEATTP